MKTRKKKLRVRKVEVFCLNNEYILTKDYIDSIVGNIKSGTKLIYTGYNLGYAKFRIKNDKNYRTIGISKKETFIIVKKQQEGKCQKQRSRNR